MAKTFPGGGGRPWSRTGAPLASRGACDVMRMGRPHLGRGPRAQAGQRGAPPTARRGGGGGGGTRRGGCCAGWEIDPPSRAVDCKEYVPMTRIYVL